MTHTCPQCNSGEMKETTSEWWRKCNECDHLEFTYKPMPHQLRFHKDPAKFKMYGGKLNLPPCKKQEPNSVEL